jgi:hypothetical protein
MRYTKRPVTVNAVQLKAIPSKEFSIQSVNPASFFMGDEYPAWLARAFEEELTFDLSQRYVRIQLINGDIAEPSDFIILSQRTLYTLPAKLFTAMYMINPEYEMPAP